MPKHYKDNARIAGELMEFLKGKKVIKASQSPYATVDRPTCSPDGRIHFAPKDSDQVAELIKLYEEIVNSLCKALE